jgi:lipopolysaccharide export system permease protein
VLKKLDVYIIRKFLSTFLFMIGAFILIAVVFDISENIDELLKARAPWYRIVSEYYLNFCFYFGTLLSSFIIFLTIIWFTSKLAQQSEVIAILSGGVSYARFIRPYFIASGILVAVLLYFSHVVVPRANRQKYEFEVNYMKDPITVTEKNIHREIEPGTIAYFYGFRPETISGDNFSLERWKDGKLTYKMIAASAQYLPDQQKWRIMNAQIRTFDADGAATLQMRAQLDTILPMDEQDFGLRSEITSAMGYSELSDFIEAQRLGGSGRVAEFEVELYNRTASPFSIFVLTLIGVSIASRKQRGGIGMHLMLAVIIGFIFVFISRMTTVSAMNLGFPSWLAVWVPNVIFSGVGFLLYSRAQK